MDADAARMRQLLASTFKAFQQRALVAARKKHEERTAKITAQQFQLPASPGERRALLDAVIAQHQQAGRMLIAQHCDATVTYGTLSGSEARIVGADESAIITVARSGSRGRERFSAAHELAHWLRDAGEIALLCNASRGVR
jgi:hypothetical protein